MLKKVLHPLEVGKMVVLEETKVSNVACVVVDLSFTKLLYFLVGNVEVSFPYAYINPYYASHCGGFSNEDILGQPHDFMYQTDPITRTQETSACSSQVHTQPMSTGWDESSEAVNNVVKNYFNNQVSGLGAETQELTLVDVDDNLEIPSLISAASCNLTLAGDKRMRPSKKYDTEYCSNKNIDILLSALLAKQKIQISIPMKNKLIRGPGADYVNVMSWKPIISRLPSTDKEVIPNGYNFGDFTKWLLGKKDDSEYLELMQLLNEAPIEMNTGVKYYLCFQIAVPVKNMSIGLDADEVELVKEASDHLNALTKHIPDKLQYFHNLPSKMVNK